MNLRQICLTIPRKTNLILFYDPQAYTGQDDGQYRPQPQYQAQAPPQPQYRPQPQYQAQPQKQQPEDYDVSFQLSNKSIGGLMIV